MHLDYTPEQESLRKELREYFADLLAEVSPDEIGAPGEGSPRFRQLVRQLGKDGWLGIGWPKEYGGQGRTAMEQFIFFDEVQRAGAPFPFVTLNTVGPTIMRFGTDDQKSYFLPGILAGEINFAIGYTEPEAGTDLASLRTRAVRDGDEWLVNGSKVFTSGANQADYIWLAARTNSDVPKHKGISIFAVPTDSPGFSWSPIVTVGGVVTTATYYSDLRLGPDALIGEVNEGWRMITNQLNHERVGLAAMGGMAHRLVDEVTQWAGQQAAGPDGGRLIDVAWVQLALAKVHARMDAMKLLNWRLASTLDAGQLGPADASAAKVYGTECLVEVYRSLLEILGPAGYLRKGSPGVPLQGRVEQAARAAQINTFGGGVNEVQREIVAAAGLGMTRQARQA